MPEQMIDLDTPYTAEGQLVSAQVRLRLLRIQGRLHLDALGRYWPMPHVPRRPGREFGRMLRRARAWLRGR